MFLRLFIFVLFPCLALAQADTVKKAVSTKAVKNIFKSPSGIDIPPQEYMNMANSGLYNISYDILNDTTLVYKLDSTTLLKSLGKKITLPALKDASGKPYHYDHKKLLVVNFWSTSCKPCIEELDSLNAITTQFPGVKFIAITADPVGTVQQFLSKKPFNYTILFAPESSIHSLYVESYPTHFIIDQQSYLRWIRAGKATQLADKINALKK